MTDLCALISELRFLQLHGRVKNLAVTFRVSVQGTASGTFTKDDGNPGKVEGLVLTYENTSTEAESAKFEGQDFTVKFDTGVINSGHYWVKNATIGENSTVDVKVNLYEKLKTLAEDKESDASGKSVSFNVVPEKVKVEITKVSFNLGNLVLTAKKVDKPETDAEIGIDFVKFLPVLGATESFSIKADDAVIENNDLSKIGVFQVPLMQTIDPRQNLIARLSSDASSENVKNSDWYFFNERKSALFKDDSENWEWGNLSTRVVAGGKDLDNFSNPKNPKRADNIIIDHKDTEETTDPAWQGDDKDKHISTAVIRNAPMRSPWELGFIHRGIPFQTINLKKAGGIDGDDTLGEKAHDAGKFSDWTNENGTKYENGDAGILDQIKMTEYNKSYGKVDLESLAVAQPWWAVSGTNPEVKEMNLALFKSLFNKIRRQEAYQFLAESVEDNKVYTDAGALTGSPYTIPADLAVPTVVTSILRSKILNTDAAKWVFTTDTTDAAQEELVGKTFNLIEGKSFTPPSVFRVVIVAQTIRDLEGPISRWDLNATPNVLRQPATDAKLSVFDYDSDNKIYYDEILSECRMLVTIERVVYIASDGTPRARLRVKQIEYLD